MNTNLNTVFAVTKSTNVQSIKSSSKNESDVGTNPTTDQEGNIEKDDQGSKTNKIVENEEKKKSHHLQKTRGFYQLKGILKFQIKQIQLLMVRQSM